MWGGSHASHKEPAELVALPRRKFSLLPGYVSCPRLNPWILGAEALDKGCRGRSFLVFPCLVHLHMIQGCLYCDFMKCGCNWASLGIGDSKIGLEVVWPLCERVPTFLKWDCDRTTKPVLTWQYILKSEMCSQNCEGELCSLRVPTSNGLMVERNTCECSLIRVLMALPSTADSANSTVGSRVLAVA